MTEWIVGKFDAWFASNQPKDDPDDEPLPLVSCDDEEDEDETEDLTERKDGDGDDDSSEPATPEQKAVVGKVLPSKILLGDVACGDIEVDMTGQLQSVRGTNSNNCQSPFNGSRNLSSQPRSINSVLCGQPSAAFLSNPLGSNAYCNAASRSIFPLDKLERRLSAGSSISSKSSSTTSTVSKGGQAKKGKRALKEENDEDDDEEGDEVEPVKKKKKKVAKASAKLTGNLFFLFALLILWI